MAWARRRLPHVEIDTVGEMTDTFDNFIDRIASTTALDSVDDEADVADEDTCSPPELATTFCIQYKPQDESVVSLKNDYVLNLCADDSFTRIAAGLSNTAVQIYDLGVAGELTTIQAERVAKASGNAIGDSAVTICGVRFLDETPYTLLVGTSEGLVRLFDLRATGEQARFQYVHDSEASSAPGSMTCFDRNANGRIICSGTEQYMHNVYLLFYDVRERKQMGGYCESHQDDVTAVSFHARNSDRLCSGGTDGLINVFDIKQSDEDDALLNTINTESSVHKLNWHRNVYEQDVISCITHTNDYKSYECLEGDELAAFERSAITAGIRRSNTANCNLINAHNFGDDGVFLLAGTNSNRGEVLRSVSVETKQTLQPLANFVGNKQIVRESLFDAQRNLLVTGGESGIITVWTQDAAIRNSSTSKLKQKQKSKSLKKTPY